jgi:uncharacterized protein YkwD
MKATLLDAVMTSIEALQQVPGTKLQHIESTLRQLKADLREYYNDYPVALDDLIEEAAIAHAEDMAFMNGVASGEEPYWQRPEEDESYGKY